MVPRDRIDHEDKPRSVGVFVLPAMSESHDRPLKKSETPEVLDFASSLTPAHCD
jgi:hypothetical protein